MHVKHRPILKKGRYYHPLTLYAQRGLLDIILWKLGLYNDGIVRGKLDKQKKENHPYSCSDSEKPSVIWINHSTFLIKVFNLTILTDPIWSQRCSPFFGFGPKRCVSTPFTIDELPKIDCVLISHNHYDHLDRATVKALHKKFPHILWMVPLNLKKWFALQGIENVKEMSWWDEHSCTFSEKKPAVKISCVPAQHWSGRKIFDYRKTLWCGWVMQITMQDQVKTFYFAGDTGYNDVDFKSIGNTWKGIDLSLIPIGAYMPQVFMNPDHISPEEAVRIHNDVGSKFSIGMHFGTFRLSDEELMRPSYDLSMELSKKQIEPKFFRTLAHGYEINW